MLRYHVVLKFDPESTRKLAHPSLNLPRTSIPALPAITMHRLSKYIVTAFFYSPFVIRPYKCFRRFWLFKNFMSDLIVRKRFDSITVENLNELCSKCEEFGESFSPEKIKNFLNKMDDIGIIFFAKKEGDSGVVYRF